jgi:hypothetical protein
MIGRTSECASASSCPNAPRQQPKRTTNSTAQAGFVEHQRARERERKSTDQQVARFVVVIGRPQPF